MLNIIKERYAYLIDETADFILGGLYGFKNLDFDNPEIEAAVKKGIEEMLEDRENQWVVAIATGWRPKDIYWPDAVDEFTAAVKDDLKKSWELYLEESEE
jgi:hypothetical protein